MATASLEEPNPDGWQALHNRGVALAQAEQYEEARSCLRHAIQTAPGRVESFVDLGKICKDLGELDESVRCFEGALAIQDGAELHNLLASSLALQGRIVEAVAHFRETLHQQPRYQAAHSNLLLALSHDPKADPSSLLAEHRWWDRLHGQGMSLYPTFTNVADPSKRLRIGYVSPDFRRHALTPFFEPILAVHNSAENETYAYAELRTADATTSRLQQQFRYWRLTIGQTDHQVAEQIRADGIDILVDLAGHSARNRLGVFTHKPAPVQVTYLGYASTTGLSTIDYRLTDAIADPPGELTHHTEELVRLPGCFCCYAPPSDAPEVGPLPAGEHNPITFGSPHKLVKLNDAVIALWSRLLQTAPDSRLLMVRNTLAGETAERFRRKFQEHGIAPERLDVRQAVDGPAGYLDVYQSMDILLDVFPWCGHAITCEALWMGVPVVTLSGNRFAGRMGASLLTQLGLSDLVAANAPQYVEIAARLAQDRQTLAQLRSSLRERLRNSPICDAQRFTRHLEAAYRWMWQRWCAGQKAV